MTREGALGRYKPQGCKIALEVSGLTPNAKMMGPFPRGFPERADFRTIAGYEQRHRKCDFPTNVLHIGTSWHTGTEVPPGRRPYEIQRKQNRTDARDILPAGGRFLRRPIKNPA